MDELERPRRLRAPVSFVQLLRASALVCAAAVVLAYGAWLLYRWYHSWSAR